MKLTFNKKYFIWALALLGAELLIATVFSGIGFIRGYIGDVLVVILLYYLVLSFVKVKDKTRLIWGIIIFAVAVEVMQYLGVATYLGFTRGSLGYILLGNHFSWADLVCYAIGCLILYLKPNT
ncbi:ribosomal maturation YjgA family protein [Capnocytophaga sp. HP1101]